MNFSTSPALLLFCSLVALAWISCKENTSHQTETKDGTETVMDEGLRILDKETFASAIKKSGAIILDVRTPQEFEQGHIEKAMNINFFDPEFKYKLLDLNRNKKYYIYCKNETRSYRSMKFMEDNDFKHVFILKDGYEGWNTATAE